MARGWDPPELRNQLEVLSLIGVVSDQSDAQLLRRFLEGPESASKAAMTALVDRHGPMVMRACRHVLDDAHDAEDAFQATFLVLGRKAGSVCRAESLAGWLHSVAIRVAKRSKADAARRRLHERRGGEMKAMQRQAGAGDPDAWLELHEEIAGLPARYREPLVLHYLEGLSSEATASRIGCPRGTILSRLSRARDRLRGRLIRRGSAPLDFARLSPLPVPIAALQAATQAVLHPEGASLLSIILMKKEVAMVSVLGWKRAFLLLLACGSTTVSISLAVAPGAQDDPRIKEPSAISQEPRPPVEVKKKAEPSNEAHSLAFAPDGRAVAAQCADGSVVILDATTGDRRFQVKDHDGSVQVVAYSPDGSVLAGACTGNLVKFWDPATGELKRTATAFGDPSFRPGSSFSFSPDGNRLAIAGYSRLDRGNPSGTEDLFEVRLIDVPTGRPAWSHMGRGEGATAVAFSPDGRTLAISRGSSVRLWDATTGEPGAVFKTERGGRNQQLAFSPDGTKLAGGGYFMLNRRMIGQVTLWDPRTGTLLRTMDAPGHTSSIAFSPDGKTIAAGGDGPVRGYQTKAGDEGHMLVSETRLWDVSTGTRLWSSEGDLASVTSLVFAPDGNSLIRCDGESVAQIDSKTGKVLRILMTIPRRL